MANKKDQVFQLSLTEVAFIITFLLLILLGFLIFREKNERQAAEAELKQVQSAERATTALTSAKDELVQALKAGNAAAPDKVISSLVEAAKVAAERDSLRQRVDELNGKLTALVAVERAVQNSVPAERQRALQEKVGEALLLREQIEQAVIAADEKRAAGAGAASAAAAVNPAPPPAPAPARRPTRQLVDKVTEALQTSAALDQQLRAATSTGLGPDRERQIERLVKDAAAYARQAETVGSRADPVKENADLRGQVAFLKGRLESRGGRDYPPCWADEHGKVEFLFSLETRPGQVLVQPAWPARREADARALPGLDGALQGPHSMGDFAARIRPVFNWSRSQEIECRHYVQLKSSIGDAVESDRARLMIENYFYKVEQRR